MGMGMWQGDGPHNEIGSGIWPLNPKPLPKRTIDLPWDSWPNYKKVIFNGQEYAKIGDRLYTKHAIDRMQPSGKRYTIGDAIKQVGSVEGRGVAPQFVEDVIESSTPVTQPNGNISNVSGSVEVITNPAGCVVTVITR